MMGSLRQATKNTMFDQWLEAITTQPAPPHDPLHPPHAAADGTDAHAHADGAAAVQLQQQPDPELARYLPAPGGGGAAAAPPPVAAAEGERTAAAAPPPPPPDGAIAAAGTATATPVESSTFRPGWEDIFRMNQKQLEAAVMRVSADPNLEPGRKAYLIQNIMVSRYIVAQQRRMQREAQEQHGGGDAAAAVEGAEAEALLPPPALGGAGGGAGGWPWRTFYDRQQGVLGCKHYRRKAQLVAPCCQRAYTCRCAASVLRACCAALCRAALRCAACERAPGSEKGQAAGSKP